MSKVLKITEAASYDEWEGTGSITITVVADGKQLHCVSFYDGEPEDNNLSRNFSDCHSITQVLATVAEYVAKGYTVEFAEEQP